MADSRRKSTRSARRIAGAGAGLSPGPRLRPCAALVLRALLVALCLWAAPGPSGGEARAQGIDIRSLLGAGSFGADTGDEKAPADRTEAKSAGEAAAGGGAVSASPLGPAGLSALAGYGRLAMEDSDAGDDTAEATMLRRTSENVAIFRARVQQVVAEASRAGLTAAAARLDLASPTGNGGYFAGVALVTMILILIGRAVMQLWAFYVARPVMVHAQRHFPPQGMTGKMPVLAIRMGLTVAAALITVTVAGGLGLALVGNHAPTQVTAGIMLAFYAIYILVNTLWRMALNPYLPEYRIPRISDRDARRLYLWLAVTTAFGIASNAYVTWLREMGVRNEMVTLNSIALSVVSTALALALVWVNRKGVSAMILGGRRTWEATWIAALGARIWAPALTLYLVVAWAEQAVREIMGYDKSISLLAGIFITLGLALAVQGVGLYLVEHFFTRSRMLRKAREAALRRDREEDEGVLPTPGPTSGPTGGQVGSPAAATTPAAYPAASAVAERRAEPFPEPAPETGGDTGAETAPSAPQGPAETSAEAAPGAAPAQDAPRRQQPEDPRPGVSGDEAADGDSGGDDDGDDEGGGRVVVPPRPAADPARAADGETAGPRQGAAPAGTGTETGVGAETSEAEVHPVFRPTPTMRSFEDLARRVVTLFSLGTAAYALLVIWGGRDVFSDGTRFGDAQDLLETLFFGYIAFHAVRIWLDRRIEEEVGDDMPLAEPGDEGGGASAYSRLGTLLPLFRAAVLIVIGASVAIIAATEIGVNVAPLFAGAGIVGIAVGFGAQTLVRDILSGVFFLLDDAFRKGEYINVGEVKGTVEKISLRSMQLRHHLGALHTIPFGEIKHLTNYARDWVMMKLPLRLTYDTDVEKVRKLIKKLGQELLEHPTEGRKFVQPLKSQGVYMMEDSAMIIRVKYMTRPGDQWTTRKLVYQRIREIFEKEGIHFAHREVTVRLPDLPHDRPLTEQESEAVGAAARRAIEEERKGSASMADMIEGR